MIDVRLSGDRLTGTQLLGLSINQPLNQRATCDMQTHWTLEDALESKLLLDDGSGCILLDDGPGCILLDGDFGRRLPTFNETITVDYPDTTYRQRVLDRIPDLYWGLDERPGRAEVRDWSGRGNPGTVGDGVLLRDLGRLRGAVPYGGAVRPNTGRITAAGFTPPETAALQFWFSRPARSSHDDWMVTMQSDRGTWGVGHDATRIYFDFGVGRPVVPDVAAVFDVWRLVTITWTPDRMAVYIDGAEHWSGPVAAVPPWSPAAGVEIYEGDYWIDELSVVPAEESADEAAGDYAARTHYRLFEGVALDPDVSGSEASGFADVAISGVGQWMRLEREAVEAPVVTDAARLIPDIMDDFLDGRDLGLTTDGIAAPVAAGRERFALKYLSEVFPALMDAAAGDFWGEPWGELQGVPRSGFELMPGLRFDGTNVTSSSNAVDSQNLRTRQVLVGAGGQRAETTQWFTGDGSRRVFGPLELAPDTILEIEVDGVGEAWTGMGAVWSVDPSTHTLTRTAAPPAPGADAPVIDGVVRNIRFTYRSDFPLLAVREDEASTRSYGRWTRIDEDRTADTVALADERAGRLLRRHRRPTNRINAETQRGAFGALVPGVLARVHLPRLHGIVETDMLLTSVRTDVMVGASNDLVHSVELTAGEYESASLDYIKNIGRITTPIASPPGERNTPAIYSIDPTDAAFEGIVLPAFLGGSSANANIERDVWTPIWGGAFAPLSGRALAGLRGAMVLLFTAKVVAPDAGAWTAAVQLYNTDDNVAVGTAQPVTTQGWADYTVPRIVLHGETKRYRLYYRLTYGGADPRRPALFVVGGTLAAGGGVG